MTENETVASGSEAATVAGRTAISEQDARVRSLAITPIDGAPEDLVAFGQRYWAIQGVDQYGKVIWAEAATKIDPAMGRPHFVAAAGVEATVRDATCTRCGTTPGRAKSRSDFDYYVASGQTEWSDCGRCAKNFLTGVARETDPAALARRVSQREAEVLRAEETRRPWEQQERIRSVERAWNAARRQWVQDHYPLTFTNAPDEATVSDALDRLQAPLRAEAAALAALRYAPTATPLSPLQKWDTPLAPDLELERDLAADWWRHGLLAVHPDTDLDDFAWEQDTKEVLAAADGDPGALPEPSASGIYTRYVSWYSRHGTSLGTSVERLDAALAARLDPARLTATRQEALLDLVTTLIAAETVRYFEFQLDTHNLPPVPDNHRARMTEAASRLGEVRSLGEAYNVAWRAARDAAAAAQRQLRAPKVKMTVHGLNMFETHAQAALDLSRDVPAYRPDNRVPLAALTRTVFHTILGADPSTTSRRDISDRLPAPAAPMPASAAPAQPQPDEQVSPREEDLPDAPVVTARALQLLAEPPQPYDPAEVRHALQWVADGDIDPDSALRLAARAVISVYDAVAACTSEPYAPVVAAAAAVNLVSNDPTPSDADDSDVLYRGEILAQAIDLATQPDAFLPPTPA